MQPNPQETADLVTFTEEILNGKLHFLCSVREMFLMEMEAMEDNFWGAKKLWRVILNGRTNDYIMPK